MEKSIYTFILRYSWKSQLFLVLLTLCSFPFLYYSLDLPKHIINNAIRDFDTSTTLFGYSVEQVSYLMILSGVFLFLVLINGAFKYSINVLKGRIGERMLQRLRLELYAHVLRFPLPHFKKISGGVITPMITTETEPLGWFIGEAIAQPVFQGGTLLVYVFFIFLQDPFLGFAATALYPLQSILIPYLQKKINALTKQRIHIVRAMSDKINESVTAIQEIHNHGTAASHKRTINASLSMIYTLRYKIYQRKFFVKFLNNFINQITPFFFYSIGGYFIIRGDLSFGALVAVLAAYKDMAGPWREILNYYQKKEDTKLKYEQIIEQFRVKNLLPSDRQERYPQDESLSIRGHIHLNNVSLEEEQSNIKLLDSLNHTINLEQTTAIISETNEILPLLLSRLIVPTSGQILLNDQNFTTLPETFTGRRIAYVGARPYLFNSTLRENLLYGLHAWSPHRSQADSNGQHLENHGSDQRARADLGMALYSPYSCYEELWRSLLTLLDRFKLSMDIYEFGLLGYIDPKKYPDAAERILQARIAMNEILADERFSTLLERFDANQVNKSATIQTNILFGKSNDPALEDQTLATHPYVRKILDQTGLTQTFIHAGYDVAKSLLEMFSDLSTDHPLFKRYNLIEPDNFERFSHLCQKITTKGFDHLLHQESTDLIALIFKVIPTQHRFCFLTPEVMDAILQARRLFAQNVSQTTLYKSIEFYDYQRYNSQATLQENILFGRLRSYGTRTKELHALLKDVVDRLGLREMILDIGLEFVVGTEGARLSSVQRQKISLVRALLKQPELLILDKATVGFDREHQEYIHEIILDLYKERGLIWFVQEPRLALKADSVMIFDGEHFVEQGVPEHLANDSTSIFAQKLKQ